MDFREISGGIVFFFVSINWHFGFFAKLLSPQAACIRRLRVDSSFLGCLTNKNACLTKLLGLNSCLISVQLISVACIRTLLC